MEEQTPSVWLYRWNAFSDASEELICWSVFHSADWRENNTRLDLDKLQKRFPDSTEKYIDENDVEQERIVYGYFSEHGRSNDDNPPVITMSDVIKGDR